MFGIGSNAFPDLLFFVEKNLFTGILVLLMQVLDLGVL
jgi:hypothetical protein